MDPRKLKLKVHSRNFSKEELVVNIEVLAREKLPVRDGDVLEVFAPDDQQKDYRLHLLLQVKVLSPDVQSKGGPLSILNDVAAAFNLTGVREVCVRKVEREWVGLDLVELSFKDQYITRSDMWRFTCSLLKKCVYVGKYLEHSDMRLQAHCAWSQGQRVRAGAVVRSTKVVFRSASAHVFLFIQISSEMWDFDPSGEFFFDKGVSGFLRELFERWKEASCNHDVTIVFFWRHYYDTKTLDNLPDSVTDHLQQDKRGLYYEDFYRVIVEGVTLSDWSSQLVHIKKSFLKLLPLIAATRGNDVKPCHAAEGNILEAINLALNLFEKHYIDTNLHISGQQIVIVTAGTGMFDVDHALMRLTNERLIDGGICTDLVTLRDQPLHSVPLFRFHSQEDEFFSIPRWINYSFYKSPCERGQEGFQPQIYLSDHLVNTYLQKPKTTQKSYKLFKPHAAVDPQLPNWVDYDLYDASIFGKQGTVELERVFSEGKISEQRGGGEADGDGRCYSESPPANFNSKASPPNNDPFESGSTGSSSEGRATHHAEQVKTKGSNVREEVFTRSLKPVRYRYKSENWGDGSADKTISSSGTSRGILFSVGSAEAGRQFLGGPQANDAKFTPKKRISFINPFKPENMHEETMATQRRWMHVFPVNKRGVAFQVHHATSDEQLERSIFVNISAADVQSNTETASSNSVGRKSILKRPIRSIAAPKQARDAAAENSALGSSPLRSSLARRRLLPLGQSPTPASALFEEVKSRKWNLGTPKNSLLSLSPGTTRSQQSVGNNSLVSLRANLAGTPNALRLNKERLHEPTVQRISEDFASARRTGIDWTSLMEPAFLPITTDYYPPKAILDRDYFEYNTNLVVYKWGETGGEGTEEKRSPMWHSDHSSMTTFQAFQEMIAQRLSQGFQLVFSHAGGHGGGGGRKGGGGGGGGGGGKLSQRELSSVFVLHEAVAELQEAVKTKHTGRRRTIGQISVQMGLSRVFQRIVLAYQDISVFIYRPKTQSHSPSWPYSYQLACCQEESFQPSSTHFSLSSEDYNWNFLDQHVCGYPEFENLGESQRYWELQYYLLPKQPPLLFPFHSSSDQQRQQEEMLISNFVRFLEFLNHIKRAPGTGSRGTSCYSRQSSLPVSVLSAGWTGSSRGSLASVDSNITFTSPTPSITSISIPLPTSSLTPSHVTPSHVTPSRPTPRTRKLSEIEEDEESTRNGQKNGRRQGEREKGERASLPQSRTEGKHKSGGGVSGEAPIRRAKSGDNLNQMERESRQKSPSPSPSPSSSSSSLLKRESCSKLSPKTARRRVIKDLRRLTVPDAHWERSPALASLPAASSRSSVQRDPDNDLESSLVCSKLEGGLLDTREYLSHESPLEAIHKWMEDESDGIDFLGSQPGLRKRCFVAMDAVDWILDNVHNISTRRGAVKILQSMITKELVVHASSDIMVPFLDGYFIYCLLQRSSKEDTSKDKLDSSFIIVDPTYPDYDTFSKRWFETEIQYPLHLLFRSPQFSRPSPEGSPSHSPSPPPTGRSPYYMEFTQFENDAFSPCMSNRCVELNPDPHFHSDRPEWCYVHYDPVYSPTQVFQIRFQWMVATANLMSSMIQGWVHKASMCDFNLVVVPMHKNLSGEMKLTHPFRGSTFIPLSLPSEEEEKWGGQTSSQFSENLNKLLIAITSKFNFLQVFSPPTLESGIISPHYPSESADHCSLAPVYVHHTGSVVLHPVLELPHTGHHESTSLTSTHSQGAWRGSQLLAARSGSVASRLSSLRQSLGSTSSRSSREAARDGGGEGPQSLRCGFYWHRNRLLPKQKNIPPSLLAQYDSLYEKFVAHCQNKDGMLTELCDHIFS